MTTYWSRRNKNAIILFGVDQTSQQHPSAQLLSNLGIRKHDRGVGGFIEENQLKCYLAHTFVLWL